MGEGESLADRLRRFRDNQLTNPRFHSHVLRFAVTRRVARRQANALFDVVAGFVYSQVLVACVRLGVFRLLADGPLGSAALQEQLDLRDRAFSHLMDAAVALRLLERRGDERIGLGTLGAAVLAHPGVAAMVEHHDLLYADLRDPVALLRGEPRERKLASYWGYATAQRPSAASEHEVAAYSRLMSESQGVVARAVLAAYPLQRHRSLLDVGGGLATFAMAAVRSTTALKATVFDLPAVAALASQEIARAGLTDRVRAVGGDFFRDALPAGSDVVTFVRVLHDHEDDRVIALLAAARAALAPGGIVLIAEPMADATPAGEATAAYFSFYLLAMGSGRPRSAREFDTLLARAGLRAVAWPRTQLAQHASVIVAARS